MDQTPENLRSDLNELEDRNLFSITMKEGLGASVEVNCKEDFDLMIVCTIIGHLLIDDPRFSAGFFAAMEMMEDESFRDKIGSSCISMPDFNSLLRKSTKPDKQ